MNTELTLTNPSQLSGVLTIDPETYVTEVFNPFRAELEILKAEAETVTYDIATTAGMKTAVEHRAKFRDMRVNAEKARKERKAPILEIGKLLDSRYKEIEAEITPFETRFDNDIKQEESRKEAERQAKIAAERARIDAIKSLIAIIRDLPLQAVGKSSAEISAMIGNLVNEPIDDRYQEFLDEAKAVRLDVLDKLAKAETAQRGIEIAADTQRQEAARLAEEREELAKLRAEAEARRSAEKAAADAELKEVRDKMNAEAEALRLEREEMERQKAVVAEAHAKHLAEQESIGRAAEKAFNPVPFPFPTKEVAPVEAQTTPPTLTLGKIGERLGFNLTAEFLRSLGYEPATSKGAAKLYHEDQWEFICEDLMSHIKMARVMHKQAA